jgi:hypothetical protein
MAPQKLTAKYAYILLAWEANVKKSHGAFHGQVLLAARNESCSSSSVEMSILAPCNP